MGLWCEKVRLLCQRVCIASIFYCTVMPEMRCYAVVSRFWLTTQSHVQHAHDAGQGYIWLAHRSIGDAAWALARHSKELWEELLCDTLNDTIYRIAVQWQVRCPSQLRHYCWSRH